jgi:ABC-type uncharacterized transport system substrate-binding protein
MSNSFCIASQKKFLRHAICRILESNCLEEISSVHSFLCVFSFITVRRNWNSTEPVDPKGVRVAVCECLEHAARREARRRATEQIKAVRF